MDGVSR